MLDPCKVKLAKPVPAPLARSIELPNPAPNENKAVALPILPTTDTAAKALPLTPYPPHTRTDVSDTHSVASTAD